MLHLASPSPMSHAGLRQTAIVLFLTPIGLYAATAYTFSASHRASRGLDICWCNGYTV